MSERVQLFKKLRDSLDSRFAYTKAVVSVNISSQIRSLRARRTMTQKDLAIASGMKQARISVLEHPGESVNLETLVRLAAAFRVGLIVKFVPFSEMFSWKSKYAPDSFDATPIERDIAFVEPRKAMVSSESASETTMTFWKAQRDSRGLLSASHSAAMTETSIPPQVINGSVSLRDISQDSFYKA